MPRLSASTNLTSIAKELKVSISTVSRALNDAEGIHPETRQRVIAAAEARGYELPSRAAAVNTRPRNILALAHSDALSTGQHYLAGISRAAVPLNLAILSHHLAVKDAESVLDPRFQPAAMKAGLVEGLVLIHRWPRELMARLSERWPAVSIVHDYPGVPIDHVGIDDRMGIGELVRRYHGTGHREIGFFGFCRGISWSLSRFAAYMEALADAALPYGPDYVVEITLEEALALNSFPPGAWSEQIVDLVKRGVKAWICPSSATADTLCRFFLSRGMKIPEKIEVTGFHRRMIENPDLPVLTSTSVSDDELGAAALQRLVHRIQHPQESRRSILLPAEFFQGATTRDGKAG